VRTIHVAGTNGKGSTAAMLAAILTETGFRTALYTSPHLVDFRERMRVDGREIPESDVVRWTRKLMPEVRRRRATFFEAVTAMAFGWFAEQDVDIAVVETGLGGRLDATNVVHPILTVITSIGLEHTAVLGRTIAAIAGEKAGIIKPRVPCVCGAMPEAARQVIGRKARQQGSSLWLSSTVRVRIREERLDGSTIVAGGWSHPTTDLVVGLAGRFQLQNVKTILKSVEVLRTLGLPIPDGSVRRGLRDVQMLTGVQGRFSMVRRRPTVIMDVAHNPDAMHALVSAVRRLRLRVSVAVVGVASDKDVRSIGRALRGIVARVVAVAARTHRSRPAADVARVFRELGLRVTEAPSVADGVRLGMRKAGRKGIVLITGSHFVAGEALSTLERRPYLTISQ
jgi:dihydrofolate synthase/folylpolyglutamate synthase